VFFGQAVNTENNKTFVAKGFTYVTQKTTEKDLTHKTLRNAYEETLGKRISDRQWQRIRHQYLRGSCNLRTVKVFASLRKINGRRAISSSDLERFSGFDEFLRILERHNAVVTGQDILDAFKRLNPSPSESTIRRWGKQLGTPLLKGKIYSPEQVQGWVQFVAQRVRFKFPDNRRSN
jgi:hypothetical protein